jgi:hypothetical protein
VTQRIAPHHTRLLEVIQEGIYLNLTSFQALILSSGIGVRWIGCNA